MIKIRIAIMITIKIMIKSRTNEDPTRPITTTPGGEVDGKTLESFAFYLFP